MKLFNKSEIMDNISIKDMPFEIQHKILYYVMKNPVSILIKDLKKEIDEINNIRYNIDKKEYDPLSFYESLKDFGYLVQPISGLFYGFYFILDRDFIDFRED